MSLGFIDEMCDWQCLAGKLQTDSRHTVRQTACQLKSLKQLITPPGSESYHSQYFSP